ncbi:MAG: hypothetical protein M3Q58_09250 [Bacteroidota bacterium]|nr:hypothetical protein [Bacteroidota bacterium]
MKDIRQIHRQAMELARQANEELRAGKKEKYIEISKKALALEKEAAFELIADFESEPTRSVLFRSAATLAFNLGDYQQSKQLIHLALSGEPHSELESELSLLNDLIKNAIESKFVVSDAVENSYLELLREKAINLKITPKENKYSKAVVVSHVIDFLKNIENSFVRFSEINFNKLFDKTDFTDYDNVLNLFKQETKQLCVDFEFNSFGVSIVSDSEIMNYGDIYSKKFTNFKKELFTNFQKDVLLPDLNASEFQSRIKEKYTPEERIQIYSPIIDSLGEKSDYKVSMTNKNFKKIIKDYSPVNKQSQEVLKPKIIKPESEDDTRVIKRTFEVTNSTGSTKSKIFSDHLDYAEFRITFENLNYLAKNVYFKDPYEVKIIFKDMVFIINDTSYKIYAQDKDYKEVQKLYSKQFIERFSKLINSNSLNAVESAIFKLMNDNTMRDW